MKKRVFVIILTFVVAFVLAGCNNIKSVFERVSEYITSFYFSNTKFGIIEFYSGKREETFEYDGRSTAKIEYGILKIKLKDDIDDQTLKACLSIDKKLYEVELEKNPFDNSFMFDIEKQISNGEKVVLDFYEKFECVELDCISKEWGIDSQKSVEIAGNVLKNFIAKTKKAGDDYECYLRVAHNIQNNERLFFYTFSIKTTKQKSANVVIDVNSGNVLVVYQSN